MYFDIESLIKPVATCSNTCDRSSNGIFERHDFCVFCLVVIEHSNPEPVFIKLHRLSNFMQTFVENLQKRSKDIYGMKQLNRNYTGSTQFSSDQCWIFERDLAKSDRVLDHCHASAEFLRFAHCKCNLKLRTVIYIPTSAHILSIYELHFICKNLHLFPEDSKLQFIPITDEKYISLPIDWYVESYADLRGVEKHVYEYLRSVDSFRFMASSLDRLLSYLHAENFSLLDNHFPKHCSDYLNYSVKRDFTPTLVSILMTNFRKKPCPVWKNGRTLSEMVSGQVSTTPEDIQHATKVSQNFGYENLGGYHDLYLTTDTCMSGGALLKSYLLY